MALCWSELSELRISATEKNKSQKTHHEDWIGKLDLHRLMATASTSPKHNLPAVIIIGVSIDFGQQNKGWLEIELNHFQMPGETCRQGCLQRTKVNPFSSMVVVWLLLHTDTTYPVLVLWALQRTKQ